VSERAEPSELAKSQRHYVAGCSLLPSRLLAIGYRSLNYSFLLHTRMHVHLISAPNRIDVSSVPPLKLASLFFTSLRRQKCAAKTVLMQRARQWSRGVINRSGVENVGVMTLLYLTASRLSFVVGLAQLRVAVPSLSPGGGEEPVSM